MKKLVLGTIAVITITALIIALIYGHGISMSHQLKTFDSLKNVAAIIFGIMGAWIAIIYPNSLINVFSKKKSQTVVIQLKRLFFPMRVATIIVISSLVAEWLSPVLHQVEYLVSHREIVRTFSFIVLTAFVLLLIWSLILTLFPLENAEAKVIDEDSKLASAARRNSRTKKKRPDVEQ